MRVELLGQLLVVGDEAVVEHGYALLGIEHGVGLLVSHRVLSGGVPRVENGQATTSLD